MLGVPVEPCISTIKAAKVAERISTWAPRRHVGVSRDYLLLGELKESPQEHVTVPSRSESSKMLKLLDISSGKPPISLIVAAIHFSIRWRAL